MTNPEEGEAPRVHLTFRRADEVAASRPEWLWRSWLLLGALNLLVGRQGSGKTSFVAYIVAQLTNAAALPGDGARPAVRCAVLSLEEPEDRLTARLKAAGADLTRVLILGDVEDLDDEGHPYRRRWMLPKDVSILERVLVDERISFAVVDGLGYSITGDSHNYAVVGSALSALAGAAERSGAAIAGLVHPPKGSSDPVTAAIGSTAWTAIPRISIVLGVDPNDESGERRVVRVGKTNYREPSSGLEFRISDDPEWECGVVTNIASSNVTAEDITAGPVGDGEKGERAEARDFLRSMLKDGPVDTAEMTKAAHAVGISDSTLKRARRDLKVTSTPTHAPNTGRLSGWTLALPEDQGATRSASGSLQNRDPLDPLDLNRTFNIPRDPVDHRAKAGPVDQTDGTLAFWSSTEADDLLASLEMEES